MLPLLLRSHWRAFPLVVVLLVAGSLVAQDAAPTRDALGDALPEGAVARLGTQRMRHAADVMGVAFTADGTQIWSVDMEGGVRLWDASSGALLRSLSAGPPPVRGFSLPADGSRIAINREGAGASVIDAGTGAVQLDLERHGERAEFSADGRWLAAWGPPFSKVDLLDAADGSTRHELNEQVKDFLSVAFSPDGSRVALVGLRQITVRESRAVLSVRDTATGDVVASAETPDAIFMDVAFSPDGRVLAVGDNHGGVGVWDAGTAEPKEVAQGIDMQVRGVCWSPDGKLIADVAPSSPRPAFGHVGREAFSVRDGATAALVREFPGHYADVSDVAFAPDGRHIASASRDHRVRLWDVGSGARLGVTAGHETGISGLAASADGALLLSAGDDGRVGVWNARTWTAQRMLPSSSSALLAVACSADGQVAAASAFDGSVQLWRPGSDGESGGWMGDRAHAARAMAFAPDGRTLATAELDGKVRVRDVAAALANKPAADQPAESLPAVLHELDAGGTAAFAVAFSPDGRWIASATSRLRLFDATTGELVRDFKGTSPIASVAFSPDGTLIATANADRTVSLFEAATGTLRGSLPAHAGRVKAVAFSLDGHTLASASDGSNVVRLWDAARLTPSGELAGHSDAVRALLALGPDLLASASADGTVLVWRLPVPAVPGG